MLRSVQYSRSLIFVIAKSMAMNFTQVALSQGIIMLELQSKECYVQIAKEMINCAKYAKFGQITKIKTSL